MTMFSLTQPFKAYGLGELQSRVVMAPMTRGFCGESHTATDAMSKYYTARAQGGVGLIITEGVIIHPSADGYNNVPYISTKEQAASWSRVVDSVHLQGGKIACQLWHCGRISHPDYTGGLAPLSSTSRQATGNNRQNNKPFGIPRAMMASDFEEVIQYFLQAASYSMEAGFDAIQLHFGHGYLVDQFLDGNVNDRVDQYGGSVENRCRFALELLSAIIQVIGAAKVIVRISPSRFMGEIYEWPELHDMLTYLIPALDSTGLRMLDVSCANSDYFETSGKIVRLIRPLWPHLLIGGASLDVEKAQHEINTGILDMVTWGRSLIANPDLVKLFASGGKIQEFSRDMLERLL